jgi:23S rRNA (uracil1939-C5)-methyltransferase
VLESVVNGWNGFHGTIHHQRNPLNPLTKQIMLDLTITSLSHAAEGVGRHAGRAAFVPFALPGETVRAEIVEEKKKFARARLIEILTPSPDRIAPRCPHHFTVTPLSPVQDGGDVSPEAKWRGEGPGVRGPACGGCHLQHLAYPAQLKFKQQMVVEQLSRIGGFTDPPVHPTLPSPAPFNYRNHVQFSLMPEGQLGFRAASSHRIIPIRECHLLHPALADLFTRIHVESAPGVERLTLRAGAEDETLVVFESEGEAPEIELDLPVSAALLRPDGAALTLAGRDYLAEVVRGRAFKVSAGSFFQVNTPVAEQMVELVLDGLALRGGETVLDLYCGVGLFTAFIAPLAGRVVGVESFPPAVADAAENLDEFDNVEIYEAPAEDVLPHLDAKFDAVVLDPPRAGCTPAVTESLAASGASRIVYVSCDPATLARDAKRLAAGGYALDWAQPLDMFPQTHHVECVAKFSGP